MLNSVGRDHYAGTRAAEVLAAGVLSGTAGSSPDGVEQNGLVLDLEAMQAGSEQSAAFVIAGRASIGANENLQLSANWQEADDSGFSVGVQDVADHATLAAAVVAQGALTDAKVYGRLELNLQLVTKRYVRAQFTANLSRSGTDTFVLSPLYLIGPGQLTPQASVGLSAV